MMQTFVKDILRIEKSMIWVLVVFSITISICTLIVPFAVQAIVNTLAFSLIKRQLIALSLIVVFILTIAGILRAYQLIIVEHKEQEIFTRLSLGLADRLSRLKPSHLEGKRDLELVNLFLEVIPIQKTIVVILIYMIEMSIQAITGCVLLALYHPYFLILDVVLLLFIFLSLIIPYKHAKKFAEDESNYKHKTISWLEEYLECRNMVKFSNHKNYLLKKVDNNVFSYLVARNGVMRKLLQHFFGFYTTYTLANAALLSLGGYLVFKAQLSLGQLVSAELVLNLLLASFLKLSYNLGTLYELVPACKKANKVFSADYELSDDEVTQTDQDNINAKLVNAPSLQLQNISFKNDKNTLVLNGLNAEIKAGNLTVITGQHGCGKSLLVDMITGFTQLQEGAIFVGNVLLSEHTTLILRKKMAFVKNIEILNDTLFNNLTLGNSNIEIERLLEIFSILKLNEAIDRLPKKINSNLVACKHALSSINLYKLMLVRAIVSEPVILIIDQVFDILPLEECRAIVHYLEQLPNTPTTLITTSNDAVANLFSEKVAL